MELIDKIFAEISLHKISDSEASQIYVQIFNILIKVMHVKNISYGDSKRTDFEILSEIITYSKNEAYELIRGTIDKISEIMNESCSKVDVFSIIAYINENYCAELSLDILADKFDIAPKYISKLIKDNLGISFVDYVAGLRVNRAKELLISTDKTISEIYIETGFNNRNTFIRTFKNFQGITPSEYRAAGSMQ